MKELLGEAFGSIMDANWKTWLGHALLGAVIVVIGTVWGFTPGAVIFAVFVAFLYREISDIVAWAVAPEPKKTLAAKVQDGFFDLTAPLLGAGLAGLLLF